MLSDNDFYDLKHVKQWISGSSSDLKQDEFVLSELDEARIMHPKVRMKQSRAYLRNLQDYYNVKLQSTRLMKAKFENRPPQMTE